MYMLALELSLDILMPGLLLWFPGSIFFPCGSC
jgi:hypothetical protein